MAESALAREEETRDIDPNIRQRRASDPSTSVWTNASAGTGKTKVLTDRVLRILLPSFDGKPGTAPQRILGLTFTKATAAEMTKRIYDRLSQWAVMTETELQEDLKDLIGKDPDNAMLRAARGLFAKVIDAPGGLKIMTIHAFCQSVLGRFPLEAGLSPHFTVVEEAESATLLNIARDHIFWTARKNANTTQTEMICRIAAQQNERQFSKLLSHLNNERGQLEKLFASYKTPEKIYASLCRILDVKPGKTAESILEDFYTGSDMNEAGLRNTCDVLAAGSKTDQAREVGIQNYMDAKPHERERFFSNYRAALMTQKDEPRKISSNLLKNNPDIVTILGQEIERIFEMEDQLRAAQMANLTSDLLNLANAILQRYAEEKSQRSVLDYNDLILHMLKLLEDPSHAAWVMFKLDGGLDHILIDEAQDTNPEQWKIISKLAEEFFSGRGQKEDTTRTVFAVGDEKQSIYSFQRAAPEEFDAMRNFFAGKTQGEKQNWRDENLNISFRSTKSILQLVDTVFSDPNMRKGLGPDMLEHISFRRGAAGLVELWPLFEPPKKTKDEPWSPPTKVLEIHTAQAQLADHIAKTISEWIGKENLLSKNRFVQPGDVMILVRTRTNFMAQIIKALKARNIPVNGVDRMVLNDQIVIQDLLVLAQFALLPEDDLTLACALKSPLIGLSEEDLYDLAVDRKGSLWQALQQSTHKNIVSYLESLLGKAAQHPPYEFFSRILQTPCPADTHSGRRAIQIRLGEEALDPLEEFLAAALQFERTHIPTLQSFVHWQKNGHANIKREQEEAGGKIRVMTVHGAKGLQAPIVILPDTIRTTKLPPGQSDHRLLWPEKTGLDMPLWAPRKDLETALYRDALGRYQQRQDEEYRRLLYVAMTRAEDRLYIAGALSAKKPLEDSWYFALRHGFETLPDVEREGDILRFTNPQTQDVEQDNKLGRSKIHSVPTIRGEVNNAAYLEWGKVTTDPSLPSVLQPSKPSQVNPAVNSPNKGRSENRYRRGNITHTLLQYLPDLPVDMRQKAAQNYVAKPGLGISKDVGASIVTEVLAILENEAFAPVFGPDSLAEVPVTGLLGENTLISGQIDRLLVQEDGIWIIDYKTGRKPPKSEKDIPESYRQQMSAYSAALAQIYPGRPIHCALLWTDGPVLMPVAVDG